MSSIVSPTACETNCSKNRAAGVGQQIMVVDDDFGVREGLKRQLRSAGYRVRTATDGIEAITLFYEHGADLILLDVKMSGIDGLETCEAIKKMADVPIIFLTGTDDHMVQDYLPELADAAGADFFLRKPVDAKLLIKLIGESLEDR